MILAPVIWILIPGLIAVLLYILRRWERIIISVGLITAISLAWIAWRFPIGDAIALRLWPGMPVFRLDPDMIIFGRSIVVDNATRPMLMLIYIVAGFWLGGAYAARPGRMFTPLVLGMAALLVSALTVQPRLYAALLVETVALMCVPILSPPGEPAKQGVIRFLAFQTIGMCLILLGEWWIPPVEASAMDATRALQSAALIGLGFALLVAVFPFHTWVPMLTEQAHPYAVTFVLFLLPVVTGLLGLNYLNRFSQMSIAPIVFDSLRLGGTFLVIIGGLWAALQNHLGRILGFAVITQIGVILFTFSLRADTTYDPLYLGIFFAWLLPLCLSMGLWGFSLYIIRNQAGDLDFHDVQGTVRRLPLATTSLLLSHLSLAGLPLLASFPISVILWSALSQQSLNSALVMLFGSASLMVAGLRSLAVLTMGGVTPGETTEENPIEPAWKISETRFQLTLLVIGGLALFVVGLMPQLFLPPLINMAFTYTNPGP